MNLSSIAGLFGIIFLIVGVLGFIPAAAPNNHLLGLFHINAAHNVVHILSGAVALACSAAGPVASRIYFQIFGIIYGLVAVLGLAVGDGYLLGIIANNTHDVWLHFLIAGASLYLGFVHRGALAQT